MGVLIRSRCRKKFEKLISGGGRFIWHLRVSEIKSFLLLKHVKCLIKYKTGYSRVTQANGNCYSAAVMTMKFLFWMCDGTVDSDVGKGDF